MKLYLAPLEGITSYIYRKALYQCFDGFDKYFIPFIRAKQNLNFSGREKKDISPENNSGMYAVPQILTRNADDFLRTANQLKEYGYQEVNLNLGCPMATVVSKTFPASSGFATPAPPTARSPWRHWQQAALPSMRASQRPST